MLIKTKYLVILVCSIFLCDGYKILGLFPHASRSHVNVFYPVMEGLARKGHQVTMISYYKYPSTSPNLRQLVLDDIGEDLLASIDMNVITGWRFERYLNTALLAYMAVRTCQNTYRQPIIQDLIKSNDNAFDVVMMEFFNTDCFAPFAYKFQAPLIGLSSCTIMQWSNARFANSYNPAYIPSNNMPYSDKLNFFERVENTLVTIGHEIFMKLMNFHDDRLAATMFDDYQMPSVRDIVKNSSLFLVNSHFSLTLPRPLVPAVIDIGGVHVADRVNKLPQSKMDLKFQINLVCNVFVLLIVSHLHCVNSYNILGIFPYPGRSHLDVFLPLMRALAEKGHNVTVLSQMPMKNPPDNYHDISLADTLHDRSVINALDMGEMSANQKHHSFFRIPRALNILHQLAVDQCELALKSNSFKQFINNYNATFDVIISEQFNTDCFLGLVRKFQAALIAISSCPLLHWTSQRVGNPTDPAYIPNSLQTRYNPHDFSSFYWRLENFILTLAHHYFYHAIQIRSDNKYARKLFGENLPSIEEIVSKTSLVLVNTHFSLNSPRPLVPGVIEIGGIHIKQPKTLPAELDKWINESTHGVIYFSLGSMIKGHTFPEEKRNEFLKAFGRLPQRILWKWEKEMPNKPDNVRVEKWMPQLDILCHPNVKAFISHGGLLGVTEAVYCGVPIVVMPQYGDQPTNAKAVEANGGGVTLLLHEANEEKVYNALTTVLDPTFRKGAQELSARFRDRPLPPLETAIYWVEYVARHRGAHHMRTAAVDMPFYKYLLLDVIVFLLCCFALTSLLFFYIAKKLLRKLFETKSNTISKQKIN